MRWLSALAGFAGLAVAGLMVALAVAPVANAWSPTDLPPGWTAEQIHTIGTTSCPWSYRIWTDGRKAWSDPFCTDSPTYQADFDAWVNAHYTPPVTTTTAASTTSATTTTSTDTATTTTSTDASTTAAPAAAPAPPTTDAATTTAPDTTPTTSTTVTAPACDVQCQIADLQSQIDTLRGQLGQLVQILETWPNIDPGILSELMALQS